MKNKKLKLNELKVKSFVTENSNENFETIKGGGDSRYDACVSAPVGCEVYTIGGCFDTTILQSKICSANDGCPTGGGCFTTTKLDTGNFGTTFGW